MITIEHWPEECWPDGKIALKASTFIRHNRKRVDPWFARYVQGIEPPNYPMPAIRYTEELFHFNGRICFFLMYRLPNNFMRPVGDSPQYQLIF